MKKSRISGWKTGRIAAAAVFLLLYGMAYSGMCIAAAPLLHAQFGPALMRCLAAFSLGTLGMLLGIVLFTFLFGRFYCSVFCPFGILQDVMIFLSRRKAVSVPNLAGLRYAVAGLTLGLLFCGWNAGFLLLDPYTNAGRVIGAFAAGGFVPLLVIAALSVWKKRIFCTAVCPVGTLLGLIARYGMFRLSIRSRCVKCGKCARSCPADCIDPASGRIDNERCVRCMNCVAACPLNSIGFALPERKEIPFNESRRAFLIHGGILLAGAAAGAALAKTGLGKLEDFARKWKILPPGAGNAERFVSRCTGCQLCTQNCPAKIIVPAPGGGPVSLDLSRGHCHFDCNKCSQVCPTGAIRPLTLAAKQKTKIAEAHFNPQKCIVFQNDEKCGRCASVCPVHAMLLRKNGTPRPVKTDLCIGCGACMEICPAPEKAMTVHAIEKQIQPEA